MEQLFVFHNQKPLGTISLYGHGDRYELEYLPSWLKGTGFSVSPHLQPGRCSSAAVREPAHARFRVVTSEELQDLITLRQQISIAMWDGKQRLSVAGVQDKLPLLIKSSGEMGFGEGHLASTHILKFGREPDIHMVVNEYICMELARLVKLPVAEVRLERFGEPVLLVRRFDRCLSTKGVERLHLIDGCQMLDLPPTYKYERPY